MHESVFKHQSVRDMAWAISSPPLIVQSSNHCVWPDSRWYRAIYNKSIPWLRHVDDDPSELDALLGSQNDRRLGKYFETLWFYWLSHQPDYEIVENNVQIIIDGETLGEIDFIIYDKLTKQTIHWELAVKFYLGAGDTSKMRNWHGPNLRDRLDIKVDHLLHRQSLLSKDKRVVQWLKQKGIRIDACAVILKGRLYFPCRLMAEYGGLDDGVLPQWCPPDLLTGLWYKVSQFEQEFDACQQFLPLINSGWMESISTLKVSEWQRKSDLFKTISKNGLRLPLHVQLKNPRHSGDRAFLMEENWPQKNT